MSLWYDKKGKTYASKGSSSWIKYYAEHLVNGLASRLEGHFAGSVGKHKATDVLTVDQRSVAEVLDNKVDKVSGMTLSHQDFTTEEKAKLAGIASGATAVGLPLLPIGSEAFNDSTNNANVPYAHLEGRQNSTQLRTFLITDYTPNTVTLDSVKGIEPGMNWFLFLKEGTGELRHSGTITGIQGNTVTIEGNTDSERNTELDIVFTPSRTPSLFGTFFVDGGSIGSHIVTETDGNFSLHLEGRLTAGTLDAHAEGTISQAFGWSSHAEGRATVTTGECSHAEGYNARATGIGSHAEGGSSIATGHYAHAEGGNTSAKSKCSHTEGNFTVAEGVSAHAEGDQTKASGKNSHTEGKSTVASGENAHAEGILSQATGINAHAEGGDTRAIGAYAHAEGYETQSSGYGSHTEGGETFASNNYAHAEGYQTRATGLRSHAEGQKTEATADSAHAEGLGTKATHSRAHAEGAYTIASGLNSHAEGGSTTASGVSSHAEGEGSVAKGGYSHAEGFYTKATSSYQHAEGKYNLEDSSNTYAHIVGNGTGENDRSNAYTLDWAGNGRFSGNVYAKNALLATKEYVDNSVAEAGGGDMLRNVYDSDRTGIVDDAEKLGGQKPDYYAKQSDMERKPIDKGTGFASAIIWDPEGASLGSTFRPIASGDGSFAAGFETRARGYCATAFGSATNANGDHSAALGDNNTAEGTSSFAIGSSLSANSYQMVVGKSNRSVAGATSSTDTDGSAFLVGNGGRGRRSNAFRVSYDGYCYGQNAFAASGADYAEYFEWEDQNPEKEDRRGYFVTLSGNKIRKATDMDDYILGVVSATPVVKGNIFSDHWQGTYLTDVFGKPLTETVAVPETTDPKTGSVIPAHTETRFLLNPDYDPELPYLGRDQRPEWAPVGLLGQLVVLDDGTCTENGFCSVGEGGIATCSAAPTSYRVLERLDESHIRILFK